MVEKITSIYVTDPELWKRFKGLISKTVSQEIMDLVRKRVAELEGQAESAGKPDYEIDRELKTEYLKVCKEAETLKKRLRRMKAYETLTQLAESLGINRDISNYKEIASGVRSQWAGPAEPVHIFTFFLECLYRKRKLEQRLDELKIYGKA